MTPEYLPKDPDGRRHRLSEECGEVVKVLGKIGRFGLDSRWPADGPSNAEALLLEIEDLKHAIAEVETDIRAHIASGGSR